MFDLCDYIYRIGFSGNVVSQGGDYGLDYGLMQINSRWCRRLGFTEEELLYPSNNLAVGIWIFKENLRRYKNLKFALSAYNSGRKTENNGYVDKVLIAQEKL